MEQGKKKKTKTSYKIHEGKRIGRSYAARKKYMQQQNNALTCALIVLVTHLHVYYIGTNNWSTRYGVGRIFRLPIDKFLKKYTRKKHHDNQSYILPFISSLDYDYIKSTDNHNEDPLLESNRKKLTDSIFSRMDSDRFFINLTDHGGIIL